MVRPPISPLLAGPKSKCPLPSRLPKIKAWIDENNPGDPLIPFSVALEERLSSLSPEDKQQAEKNAAPSALGKITQAGYTSLDVSLDRPPFGYSADLLVAHPLLHVWAG